jgi:hypothetical protein
MVLHACLSGWDTIGRRRDLSVAASRKVTYLSICVALVLLGGIVAVVASRLSPNPGPTVSKPAARPPKQPSGLDGAPSEVREFLSRVLEKIPDGGTGVSGYQFQHWEWEGKSTQEAIGIKQIPGVDPQQFIARVMDVDHYQGNLAHVEACRSERDPAFSPPEKVRFYQIISVPGVAKVQHELGLVDAGTVKGYRLVYWYLLKDQTKALDPKVAARSDFNVGAWLVAPRVVGYALSSWPKRDDVNTFQWFSMTSGANALAKKVIEDNIDGMAEWAKTVPKNR